MRPLIIGQAPGRVRSGATPLPLFPFPHNCAGARLQRLMGMTRSQYVKRTDRVNVITDWPGRNRAGTGDAFPTNEARANARRMCINKELEGREVLFVGRGVAKAFHWFAMGNLDRVDWLRAQRPLYWRECSIYGCHFYAALIPHPSGRNRWYNGPRNRHRAEEFLSAVGGRAMEDLPAE